MKIEDEVKKKISKIIADNGYYLDQVLFIKEDNTQFLRIIIDKETGYVTVNDCVKVSHLVSPIVDKMTSLQVSYILDVCSKEKGSD